jgi:DNA replication protein DnaC
MNDVTRDEPIENDRIPPELLRPRFQFSKAEQTEHALEAWRTLWEERVPERYRDGTLESLPNRKLAADLAQWVELRKTTPGLSLLLAGGTGSCKTSGALAAVRQICQTSAGIEPYPQSFSFLPFGDLLQIFRENDRTAVEFAEWTDILILDDVGTEYSTDFSGAETYRLLNARYNERRSTVITTNVPFDDLETALNPRIVARLLDPGSLIRAFGDFRG